MRSSTVNFLRGLTMLSCLIVVPTIAVFGLPMPEQVSSVLRQFGWLGEEASPMVAAAEDPPAVLDQAVSAQNPLPVPCDTAVAQASLDPAVVPASFAAPVRAAVSTPSNQEGAGLFRGIQERLRDLGATYYRLESWGEKGELFHFQCRVAVDGHTNFTRHFEATGDDPLNAMDAVLREIEDWKERTGPMETGAYSR